MGFVIKKGLWDDTGFLNLNVSSGASTNLLTNLVSYWSLNAQTTIPSGTYAGQYAYADSVTATNNPLFDAGDPQDTFGGFGNSIFTSTGGLFGGTVEVINDQNVASAPLVTNKSFSFNNKSSYSISMWFKKGVTTGGFGPWILGIGDVSVGTPASLFAIKYNGANIEIYPQGWTNNSQTTSQNIDTLIWNHALVSVNSGVLTTYIDGVASGAFTILTSQTSSNASLSLCPNISGSAYNGDGNFDEIGYWSRALTSAEVASLYNSGNGLPYSSFGSTP